MISAGHASSKLETRGEILETFQREPTEDHFSRGKENGAAVTHFWGKRVHEQVHVRPGREEVVVGQRGTLR